MLKKKIDKSDLELRIQLFNQYANAYDYLGVSEISLEYYNKAIQLGEKIQPSKNKINFLSFAYTNKANIFESLKKNDSAYYYYKKAYKITQDPISSINMASCYINFKKNKIDSASYYIKIANDSLKNYNYSEYHKIIVWEVTGDFHYHKKEYNEALEYYFKALNLSKEVKNEEEKKLMYKSIYEAYKALKDNKKASLYLQKYTFLNDSISIADKKALNISLDKILKKEKEKVREQESMKQKTNYLLIIITCILVLFIIFGYIFYKKKKREKEILIQYQQEEIFKKNIEKKNLESKVNNAFDEVLQLAKNNDPSFLAKFEQVYPEFCEKIMESYPDILNSELTFCAYLKLNLSTKEIANYTFVTTKAVQTRKSRIRKKLNIPSHEDLYRWINKI